MLGNDQAPFVCPGESRLRNVRVFADSRGAEWRNALRIQEPERLQTRRDGALVTGSGSVGAGEERKWGEGWVAVRA